MLDTLRGWLRARVDRDGQDATRDIDGGPSDVGPWQDGSSRRGRRDILPGLPYDLLDRALAGKVLQGWLQNQQQTLVPLTLRLDRLGEESISTLMRFAAVAALADAPSDEGRQAATIRWLRSVGADERALQAFREALGQEQPMSALINGIVTERLEVQAYAISVVATDQRRPAGRLFAHYIAARLSLPSDAVRSIDRRFRR